MNINKYTKQFYPFKDKKGVTSSMVCMKKAERKTKKNSSQA